MDTKKCKKCNQEKDCDKFYKYSDTKKFRSICKECHKTGECKKCKKQRNDLDFTPYSHFCNNCKASTNDIICIDCGLLKTYTNFLLKRSGQRKTVCNSCFYKRQLNRISNCREKLNKKAREYRKKCPEQAMVNAAKKRAKKENLPFNLDRMDIAIPEFCPVLGIKIKMCEGKRGAGDSSPTIDRINNNLGYVKGNIQVISWRANRLKNDGNSIEHELVFNYIQEHLESQIEYFI